MTLISAPQPSGAFSWTQASFGRVLTCAALRARHIFTSSDLQRRDDEEEWGPVASFLGVRPERLLLVQQVHGTSVALARKGGDQPWGRPAADIILSDDPDVAIGVRVADCAPILMLDDQRGVVGAVHAGWRGAAARAASTAVMAMSNVFGTHPADIVAAIGPCLGQCCGEVGPEVVHTFQAGGATDDEIAAWFTPSARDRLQMDLARANRDQLVAAGISGDHVWLSGLCTKTHSEVLHSYRAAGGRAGRMLAAIRAAIPGSR